MRRRQGGSLRDGDSWDRARDSGRRRRRLASEERSEHDRDIRDWDVNRRRRRHRSKSRSRSPSRRVEDEERRRRRKDRHRDEDKRGRDRNHRKRHERSRSRGSNREEHISIQRDKRSHDDYEREQSSERHKKSKGKGKESLNHVDIFPAISPSWSPRESQESDSMPKATTEPSSSKTSLKPSPFDLSSQFESRKAKAASPQPPASPTLSEEEDIERLRPRRRKRPFSPDFNPPSTQEISSKMDKYFEQSYDPRLDTGPMAMPEVPATGLVEGAEFESWDAMLDIIRQRREDKAERKRLERAGLIPSRDKDREKATKPSSSEAWTMDAGTSALDIKYTKRGAVREWDVGKEGF